MAAESGIGQSCREVDCSLATGEEGLQAFQGLLPTRKTAYNKSSDVIDIEAESCDDSAIQEHPEGPSMDALIGCRGLPRQAARDNVATAPCPVCSQDLFALSNTEINEHIDSCLGDDVEVND